MKIKIVLAFVSLLFCIMGVYYHLQKDGYEKQIEVLKKKTDSTLLVVDSLGKANIELNTQINLIDSNFADTNEFIEYQDSIIQILKNKRNETHHFVNNLSDSGVASQLSEYLKWRSKASGRLQRGHFDSFDCERCQTNPFRPSRQGLRGQPFRRI
jgi:hypothetical protein